MFKIINNNTSLYQMTHTGITAYTSYVYSKGFTIAQILSDHQLTNLQIKALLMSFTHVKYVLKDLLKLLVLTNIRIYIQENSLLHV